jgi:hypothetical protein
MQKIKLITPGSEKKGAQSPCCSNEPRITIKTACCPSSEKKQPSWVVGSVDSAAGNTLKVSSDWSRPDYWGMVKCRFSAFRIHYTVSSGLYAVGDPTGDSDVFVSANYKLSFDVLRRALKGLNAWILVLDTRGINVWCAAGKGTFGTDELVKRISEARIDRVVTHRRIIVPQLGAVGVCAGDVKKKTGFHVLFGPISAADIPAYIRADYTKTREMRTIRFSMIDRLVLTPMEINPFMKKFPWFALFVLLFFGFQPSGILFRPALFGALPFLLFGLASIIAGALLTPLLLPVIPFRSFAVKGWIMGSLVMMGVIPVWEVLFQGSVLLLAAAWLFFPALSSYIALQFTGSTTYTGMSGVKKELRIGVPMYISALTASLILLIVYKIREWGVA